MCVLAVTRMPPLFQLMDLGIGGGGGGVNKGDI